MPVSGRRRLQAGQEGLWTVEVTDALVARLLGRFPAFLYVGAFVLVHAAVAMILHDKSLENRFHTVLWQELAISLAITAAIIGLVRLLERTNGERRIRVAATGADPHG